MPENYVTASAPYDAATDPDGVVNWAEREFERISRALNDRPASQVLGPVTVADGASVTLPHALGGVPAFVHNEVDGIAQVAITARTKSEVTATVVTTPASGTRVLRLRVIA